MPAGQLSQGPGLTVHVIDDHKCHLASSKTCLEKSSRDSSRKYSVSAFTSKKDNGERTIPSKLDDSPKITDGMTSPLDHADSRDAPSIQEVCFILPSYVLPNMPYLFISTLRLVLNKNHCISILFHGGLGS